MTIRKLTKQESIDLVIGAKILACGGGGSETNALANINRIYESGLNFTIADLDDFKQDEYVCIIGMVGGGITEEDKLLVKDREIVQKKPMITAIRELEKFLDIEFSAFVATELGPNNSVIPMMVAAEMGKVAINGDCCGRSKPKISISTTRVAGIPITPFTIVNQYGDVQIVKETIDDVRGELIARNASRLSGGSASVARCPMRIKEAQKAVIPKTNSLAIELGKNVREANERGYNPIESIKSTLPDAEHVFSGRVKLFSRVEEGGFTAGEIIVESSKNTGVNLRIWYQNEYLLSWINDKPYVTCPDGFYIVDTKTGLGLSPWEEDFKEGRKISVFVQDASEIWKSKIGLSIFGPKAFDENWQEYKESSSFS
ncbi:MAG: DUF917 domain-containing protein [Candidatus Heimdallarchaeota archaeon]|nr:MAG: DUF917 domain-containing protein [Candidatus Heimdallarchaeota archaeon]